MREVTNEGRIKFRGAAAVVCISVLMLLCASIGLRTVTRQLLIKSWGWDNAFTQAVFADMQWMNLADPTSINKDIDWASLYPFDGGQERLADVPLRSSLVSRAENIIDRIDDIKSRIEYYASDMLVGYGAIVLASMGYDDIIGAKRNLEAKSLIFMENGYIADECAEVAHEDIDFAADGIADFAKFLEERGSRFLYVNAGSKVCPVDRQMRPEDLPREMSNENADALLDALASRGVATLDMRAELLASGRDWYDSYYRTDHHWTTGTSLWAAGVIARRLNADFGFSIDESIFEPSSYTIDRREEFELGSEGRKLASDKIKRDAFEAYLPKFGTKVRFTMPTRRTDEVGTFEEVLMNRKTIEKIAAYWDKEHLFAQDAYGSFSMAGNAHLLSVENLLPAADRGKRILMIRDSFCQYVIPPLACGVGRIDAICSEVFTGSIRRYVEETSPDVVILMPFSHNIGRVDPNTHTSALDMR